MGIAQRFTAGWTLDLKKESVKRPTEGRNLQRLLLSRPLHGLTFNYLVRSHRWIGGLYHSSASPTFPAKPGRSLSGVQRAVEPLLR